MYYIEKEQSFFKSSTLFARVKEKGASGFGGEGEGGIHKIYLCKQSICINVYVVNVNVLY